MSGERAIVGLLRQIVGGHDVQGSVGLIEWTANVTDESKLVARMRSGDQRAFGEFFDAYVVRLGNFASRRSALEPSAIEDVVQLTMINAMRKLSSFRGDASLFTWLCSICRNHLADARRKAARQPEVNSLDSVIAGSPMALPIQLHDFRDPLDECAAHSDRNEIRRAVNSLPARYAKILELRYGDELSMTEIADVFGVSETAAQSLLARARRAFKEIWPHSTQQGRQAAEAAP